MYIIAEAPKPRPFLRRCVDFHMTSLVPIFQGPIFLDLSKVVGKKTYSLMVV